MKQHPVVSLACLAFCLGCGTAAPPAAVQSSTQGSAQQVAAADNVVTGQSESSSQDQIDTTPASREQLDSYLAIFTSATNWTYGERTPGELAGTWVLENGGGHRIIFDVDGRPGTFSEELVNGKLTAGVYAVSDQGHIAAVSKGDGISLGSHFKFDGQFISGPRGPSPSVRWKRVHDGTDQGGGK